MTGGSRKARAGSLGFPLRGPPLAAVRRIRPPRPGKQIREKADRERVRVAARCRGEPFEEEMHATKKKRVPALPGKPGGPAQARRGGVPRRLSGGWAAGRRPASPVIRGSCSASKVQGRRAAQRVPTTATGTLGLPG